jgi:hypothetical protein
VVFCKKIGIADTVVTEQGIISIIAINAIISTLAYVLKNIFY